MYWDEEERQYNYDVKDVSFDPTVGAPWQKNADLESHPTEDEMDILDPYRSYRTSPDKPQKTWNYREESLDEGSMGFSSVVTGLF